MSASATWPSRTRSGSRGSPVGEKGGEAPPVKMLTPDKAARIILDGIESNQYRILVGADARLMDAVYRLHPQRAARFIYNQMRALLPQ